ncbi:12S rRNA N4-methylcytidine (m4C) methyltransferase isoform X1 [Gallus gallus]|uniref:12S rRNA N4-methylcytidine (m4C) methyltransferase isoform X1 n=1 Tax=Gallus gallus TaxID=9031 RepID=UPI000D6403F2|nr:12S rRNA N4-methylcytidine (m4C) methyltransferase isoform X1 [Gallus gallus]XP_025006408.1 12S rRNA N4-methylcytidine (m4C) methyltransferase isoform X1 [Gallus gallus]XP_025006409.1 12S rRNA N4-methylcytidine (m4C) methyltransferase isoform X1 [Gallus gallus]XP_046773969.1 12S rRNA N4-methylcytidine (m4C) methyltransferase isoform X1 [Gallus gallus]XP_046773970.1 12S rRNA N4-methylcytidine (m4C) methyltransferase isoform X1 [Gallus gallus]XP_046773971.1 12S rRNA N4-methylcytidine (m4C) me|eukprot:XP_025006408.1 probable methyltransferase-like protein 15 isoform X3 [Gallus gallus]
MINSKMLSQCLCQVNKCLLHNLKLNPIKLAALSRRIHSSVKQLSEYELTEQTTQKSETKKLPDSTENKNFGRLHVPVMMEEVVSCLSPQSGQCFLDMTFGAGGHSTALLEKASNITIYALDRDPTAYKIAQQLSESYPIPFPRDIRKQIQALLGQFSQSEALLISSGVEPGTLDGVLLDAGCSSMQFDTPERGFSLQKDGPLDMRMDSDRYPDMPTAADVVNALDQQALASILRTYGEEKHAKKIASAIVQARSIYPITRTQQLASIVAGAFPASALYARKDLLQRPTHIATKTFQGLRIFVNDELHELFIGLKTAEKFLKPGGRLVALSFHSLEDRIIKRFLHGIDMTEKYNLGSKQKIRQALKNCSKEEDTHEFPHGKSNSKWTFIQKKVLTPQAKDILTNPRARSAKLRAAVKL